MMHKNPCLLAATFWALSWLPQFGDAFPETLQTSPTSVVQMLSPQFFPQYKSERVKISYGPYLVPSMHENNGMKNFEEISTRLPCTDCLITWMQAGLEYPDGTVADADTGMWLHHTVFSNMKRNSMVCPEKKYGDRFFASGNERTPINICLDGAEKAGYYVAAEDEVAMMVELMNMDHLPREAVLTMTFEYIPYVPKKFNKVHSYWLDIGGCGSSSLPAESDAVFEYSSPSWKSNLPGRIVFIASHLHDGGTHTEIVKNDKIICDAQAFYGSCSDSGATATNGDHISRIAECVSLGKVKPGDKWSITAYYNTSQHLPMTNMDGTLEPIMGISLVYVAEGRRHHGHHHRAKHVVLACGVVVGAFVLLWARMRMHGRSFTEVFSRREVETAFADFDSKEGNHLLSEEGYDRI